MSIKQKETEKKAQAKFDKLKEQYNEVKAKEIKKPPTKVVKLKYKACCGCGCSDETILREVPYDSELKNGDRVDTMLRDDKFA
jgi:hypothetical protein